MFRIAANRIAALAFPASAFAAGCWSVSNQSHAQAEGGRGGGDGTYWEAKIATLAARRVPHVLILGGPGSGKGTSTTLRAVMAVQTSGAKPNYFALLQEQKRKDGLL